MRPKVSVAMATYNGEKYVKEQIESLLNQTYKNLEIYVRDDGSKDNTINILEEYEKNKRYLLYELQNYELKISELQKLQMKIVVKLKEKGNSKIEYD